jgi:hypothetical protein
VCVNQPSAMRLEIHVGVADVGLAFAQGLDLGAVKYKASLMSLKNMVVIRGRAILGDDLLAGFRGLLCLFGRFSHNVPS